MTDFDLGFLDERLTDAVTWFSTSPQGNGYIAGPADIFFRTGDGTVTWGWRVEPVPLEIGQIRFRRFRHPEGWAMLTDAEEPETIYLPASVELHTVSGTSGSGGTAAVVAVPAGGVPGPGDAYVLQKAAAGAAGYRVDSGWTLEAVSDALSLWAAVFLGRPVTFTGGEASPDDLVAAKALLGEDRRAPETDLGPLDQDEELHELLSGTDDVFWFQADLTWPDRGDREAFRDRVDVRMRDVTGEDVWLASIEPLEDEDGSRRRLADGGTVLLDPEDPTVIRVEWDRMVLAVSLPGTGFEPAGVAISAGSAPDTDQWDELRRVADEHEDAIVIHAPAWSEERVSLALAEWAEAWAGVTTRFIYDFDDPVSQAAIEANNALETAAPDTGSVRTATRSRCEHSDAPISELEEPLPCGRPATAYYRTEDEMVLVCEDHAPPGAKLTTLLRA